MGRTSHNGGIIMITRWLVVLMTPWMHNANQEIYWYDTMQSACEYMQAASAPRKFVFSVSTWIDPDVDSEVSEIWEFSCSSETVKKIMI